MKLITAFLLGVLLTVTFFTVKDVYYRIDRLERTVTAMLSGGQ